MFFSEKIPFHYNIIVAVTVVVVLVVGTNSNSNSSSTSRFKCILVGFLQVMDKLKTVLHLKENHHEDEEQQQEDTRGQS